MFVYNQNPSEFCTVQVLKGPKNPSALQNSGMSTFQGLQCMATNGNAIHIGPKCPLKRDVHISEVRNSGVPVHAVVREPL